MLVIIILKFNTFFPSLISRLSTIGVVILRATGNLIIGNVMTIPLPMYEENHELQDLSHAAPYHLDVQHNLMA
jgi:hypothetical protein